MSWCRTCNEYHFGMCPTVWFCSNCQTVHEDVCPQSGAGPLPPETDEAHLKCLRCGWYHHHNEMCRPAASDTHDQEPD
jgi:hypothetical protein